MKENNIEAEELRRTRRDMQQDARNNRNELKQQRAGRGRD